jgi:hypothetical protein
VGALWELAWNPSTPDSSVSAGQTIVESFGANELTLEEAQDFHATISGFGTGDTIDATNFLKTAMTYDFIENLMGPAGRSRCPIALSSVGYSPDPHAARNEFDTGLFKRPTGPNERAVVDRCPTPNAEWWTPTRQKLQPG